MYLHKEVTKKRGSGNTGILTCGKKIAEMIVASSIFGFIVDLLNALGRQVIPNRILEILSSEDSNYQLLFR